MLDVWDEDNQRCRVWQLNANQLPKNNEMVFELDYTKIHKKAFAAGRD